MGTYKVKEISIEQGNQAPADLTTWSRVASTINSGTQFTTTSAGGISYVFDAPTGKKYKVRFKGSTTATQLSFREYNTSLITTYNTGSFDDVFEFVSDPTAVVPGRIYLRNYDAGVTIIEKMEMWEIPNLDMESGTKLIENTSAGTIATQSKQAYGTWEFDMYKGGASTDYKVQIISPVSNNINNGYRLRSPSTEDILFQKVTSGVTNNLMSTALSYINIDTWYRFKVARLKSEGVFKDIPTLQTSDMVEAGGSSAYTTFTSHGRYGFEATDAGSGYGMAGTGDEIDIVNGETYLVEFDAKLNSGTGPRVLLSNTVGGSAYSSQPVLKDGRNTMYLTATGSTTGVVMFYNSSTATDYSISGLTIRRIYDADTFAVFIKGGDFGNTYNLVDTTGGSGSNPVTNSTYDSSEYFVLDLDSGDKFTNLITHSEVEQ